MISRDSHSSWHIVGAQSRFWVDKRKNEWHSFPLTTASWEIHMAAQFNEEVTEMNFLLALQLHRHASSVLLAVQDGTFWSSLFSHSLRWQSFIFSLAWHISFQLSSFQTLFYDFWNLQSMINTHIITIMV